MSDEFEPTEVADALQALDGLGAIVSLVLARFEVPASPGPVEPTTPGYETMYGVLAALVALVALVVIVAGVVSPRRRRDARRCRRRVADSGRIRHAR